MSVDVTHYLGIGVKLDYDKYCRDVDDFYIDDKFPELDMYNDDEGVKWIVDGMCGDYIYLMYVIKKTNWENFYESDATVQMDLTNISKKAEQKVKEYYDKIVTDEPWPGVALVSLFHCH